MDSSTDCIASTSSAGCVRRSTQPPTASMGSPREARRTARPRRVPSDGSEESSASREGSPTYAGPLREKRRPLVNTAYDVMSPQERSAAMSRSRSSSSSDSTSASPISPRSGNGPPALAFKPASPNQTSSVHFSSLSASPSSLSPGNTTGSAGKRHRNKKLLSLNIAAAAATSPTSSNAKGLSGTRSCPPSPMIQEGSSRDLEDLRANVRGDISMRRRGSMPRLSATSAAPDDGNPVRLIGRNGEDGMDDAEEAFPYELGPREILPGIYLGSEQNAKDITCLQKLGIAYVLNVAKEVVCPWTAEATIQEEDEEEGDTFVLAAGGSSGTSSPIPSEDSLSPASAATTVSTSGSRDPKEDRPPLRPSLMRSTASTPNLHTSRAASAEAMAAQGTPFSALHMVNEPKTPLGVRKFPRNTLTGRPALEYLHLPWGHDEDNLVGRFPTAFEFVDRAVSASGRVLIHCQCGVSRSATAMIAFVMREALCAHKPDLATVHSMHEAYNYVKDKSAWITPNMSLLYQLREYEQALSASKSNTLESPTTPSSLTPALAHLGLPFGSGEAVPVARTDAMDADPPSFGLARDAVHLT